MSFDGFSELLAGLAEWWARHGTLAVIAAGGAFAAFMAVTLLVARHNGTIHHWLARVTGVVVVGFMAEGMWEVATEGLGLRPIMAGGLFAVFDLAMVHSAFAAAAAYRRTTVRDGKGNIVTPGDPGKHGTVVWLIAATAGTVVCLNSDSLVEGLVRLVLPLLAALMWWTSLTAEGTSRKQRVTWLWTPRRFFLWIGAIKPGAEDLATINHDHLTKRMTTARLKVDAKAWPVAWWAARLERLAKDADDAVVAAVTANVRRSKHIVALTSPGEVSEYEAQLAAAAEQTTELQRNHAAELERLREVHRSDQAAAAADRQQLADQAAQLRDQLRQVEAAAAERDQAAAATVAELRDYIDQLRPAAEAAGQLQAERNAAVADRDAALERVASLVQRAPQRPEPAAPPTTNGRPLTAPRASTAPVNGSAALVPAPSTAALANLSDKERVQVVLDAALAAGRIRADQPTGQLAAYAVDQLHHELAVELTTVNRYARDWAREVLEGRRPGLSRPSLRLVDAGQSRQ